MEAVRVVVASGLCVWLLLTVLRQHPRLGGLFRWDILGIIPIWTFFAPHPGDSDFRIVYRDLLPDGTRTQWLPLSLPPQPHRWRGVWRPSKRVEKLIIDCGPSLVTDARRFGDSHRLGLPFLLIANMVESAHHDFRAQETEFAVISIQRSLADPNYRADYVSPSFRLAAGAFEDATLSMVQW